MASSQRSTSSGRKGLKVKKGGVTCGMGRVQWKKESLNAKRKGLNGIREVLYVEQKGLNAKNTRFKQEKRKVKVGGKG